MMGEKEPLGIDLRGEKGVMGGKKVFFMMFWVSFGLERIQKKY